MILLKNSASYGLLFSPDLNFSSVVQQPGLSACAAFTANSQSVFKEDVDIVPTIIDDSLSYMPWGGDNQMPFDILSLIEKDETLATCQCFNAEVCYGSGLRYDTCVATTAVKSEVEDFMLYNDLAVYFIGVNQEFAPLRSRLLRGQVLWLHRAGVYSQRGCNQDGLLEMRGSLLLPICFCRLPWQIPKIRCPQNPLR